MKTLLRKELEDELEIHSGKCIECKLCQKECEFLRKYGSPMQLAKDYDPVSSKYQVMPFECSLCRLCAAVCPVQINPAAMFLEMRREAVCRGAQDFSDYGLVLGYEKRGTSKRYSYYALPAGCNTVLFPGCTLPGTRPDKVMGLYEHINKSIPNLGIVLDCCTKPSHDLGREKHFQAMFREMQEYLLQKGVENILVACPNCYRVFKQYGESFQVKSVYEHLAKTSLPETPNISDTVTIHDPCGTRNEEQIHTAVRQLATSKSLKIEEMKHHGRKTICCGEGGSVGCVNPDYSKGWGLKRKEETSGVRILTYCAGCANFLGSVTPTSHILDLLLEPEAALAGQSKISKAPWTYLNRLRIKRQFKNRINAAVSRERTFGGPEDKAKGGMLKRITLLSLLIAVIVAVHMTGATQFIEQEKLRALILEYGTLAPIIYMLTYAVAPALFLPGLPITIVGGILFGPIWGVVYSITGASAGACIAFLISRYIGREWIQGKLRSSKWRQLDTMVEQHGWKAVAFTRLIPLFPFNLLNYAFGLTKIKFAHYAVTSFICMLPACIAFIVFSSSLLETVKGNVTFEFFIGALLIVGVSLFPIFYKQKQRYDTQKNELIPGRSKVKTYATDEGTVSIRQVLKKKGVALLAVLGVAGAASLLVYKYFYFLDAYFYTYEFFWLFNVKNLQTANVALFTDFFRPMGITTEALPQVILSNLIQNYYLLFTKPILVHATTSAFGPVIGFFFNFAAFFVVGVLSFGLGTFFLGDMMPYLKGVKLETYNKKISTPATIALPLLLAIPFFPISVVIIGGAALNITLRRTTQLMTIGFSLRLIWLLTMPDLFL